MISAAILITLFALELWAVHATRRQRETDAKIVALALRWGTDVKTVNRLIDQRVDRRLGTDQSML